MSKPLSVTKPMETHKKHKNIIHKLSNVTNKWKSITRIKHIISKPSNVTKQMDNIKNTLKIQFPNHQNPDGPNATARILTVWKLLVYAVYASPLAL
jgi:hypothetical protein